VLSTDSSDLYEFDTKESTIKKQDLSGDVEKITALTSYSTNLYSLTSSGVIYKRLKTSTGYGKRIEYITDGTMAAGVSIATDSSMYSLKENGNIVKYLAGKTQNFTVEYPFTIEKGNYLYTTQDITNIYFADTANNRVISLSDKGKFGKQYVSDKFTNINGVTASSKNLFLSANGKIYKIGL
jgi:hypothetical protein